uniref:RING-type domain-containing protein n=2 Tax=Brassica campestris TaxID=3711 RepID=M4CVE9_BRACM
MGSVCCVAVKDRKLPPPCNSSGLHSIIDLEFDDSSLASHDPIESIVPAAPPKPSEGRWSSTCSNDLATGSHYASSEGDWSLNTFSELGGVFSKGQMMSSVAAVLACGHVYHAECLETVTTEIEKYDPACPICTIGEKRVAKVTRKALNAEAEAKAKQFKRCKNRLMDTECDEFTFQKTGKALKMEPPSRSSKSTSMSFLKWHSKWSKPSSKDSVLKKWFWSRHLYNRSSSSIEFHSNR